MTARRTPRVLARALGVVSLTAPVATLLLAGTAPAAFASGGLISPTPSAGAVVSSGSTIQAKGQISRGTGTTYLTLSGPDLSPYKTQWSCPSSLTSTSPCSSTTLSVDPTPDTRPNGQWTAALSGGAGETRTFYTNFGPTAVPTGVTAKATNPAPGATTGTVALSWTYAGTEPDQWGYRLADGKGWSADVTSADAGCASGGTCSYTKQYDNAPGSTTDYSFTVTALRDSGGCGTACGDTVAGTASSPATAQLVTPQPPPSPTPGPTSSASGAPTGTTGTGGTATGSGSTTTSGGTSTKTGRKTTPFVLPTLNPVIAGRKAYALSFNSFSPKMGIPKLPPLPATTFPETVGGASESTFQPTLPYKAQPSTTTTSFLSSPLSAVRSLDTAQLAKSLAMALILLVTAAHLRLFLRQHRPE